MLEKKKDLTETQLTDSVLNQVDVAIWFADEFGQTPDYIGVIEYFDDDYIKTRTDYYVRSQCVICLVNEKQ